MLRARRTKDQWTMTLALWGMPLLKGQLRTQTIESSSVCTIHYIHLIYIRLCFVGAKPMHEYFIRSWKVVKHKLLTPVLTHTHILANAVRSHRERTSSISNPHRRFEATKGFSLVHCWHDGTTVNGGLTVWLCSRQATQTDNISNKYTLFMSPTTPVLMHLQRKKDKKQSFFN